MTPRQISGRLIGPQCEFASTLPARLPFRGVGNRDSGDLLAEAIVPDPCFWTPELPFLYRADLEISAGGDPPGKRRQEFGIRRFGPRGRDLYLEGKRMVLRGGALHESSLPKEAAYARETWTACWLSNPSEKTCQLASERGVLIIADLTETELADDKRVQSELRRLARWPAVLIVLLDRSTCIAEARMGSLKNLVLGHSISHSGAEDTQPWAQVAVVEVPTTERLSWSPTDIALPVIAARKTNCGNSLETIRAAADRLQCDLASLGDFAGYLV